MTSVASATALAAVQPVWNALLAARAGQHLPGRAWAGIGVALAGVLVLTGVDVTVSVRALAGDLLALVGGMAAAVYVAAGSQARQALPTTAYSALCYGGCSLLLLAACLIGGVPLAGYPAQVWLLLVLLTVSAQLLGHTLLNRALARVGPVTVALCILLEVPVAATLAALWLGQVPPPAALPAAVLVLAGVGAVVAAGPRAAPGSP
jgi:drug/metabolite transporter (DMT)-like permease